MSNIASFQHRLDQSRAAKAGQRPADQQHWDALVVRVNEPEVARLIVRFLDHAPSEKLKQPGLYLRAKLVLSDQFTHKEVQSKRARQETIQAAKGSLASAGYFLYRCFRLPFRAVRDLAAITRNRRSPNRPIFHH